MRAFISACILSWAQLQMTACPFDLLGSSGDTKSSGKAALFSSIPEKLHRRVFVLTAQFFELTNDVKEMTHMLNGSESHLSKGRSTEDTVNQMDKTFPERGSFGAMACIVGSFGIHGAKSVLTRLTPCII